MKNPVHNAGYELVYIIGACSLLFVHNFTQNEIKLTLILIPNHPAKPTINRHLMKKKKTKSNR
jgi:hypothetical protein